MKKVPNKMAEKWQFEVFCINGFLEHTADKLSVQTLKLLRICPETAGTVASLDNRNPACLTNHRETQCW